MCSESLDDGLQAVGLKYCHQTPSAGERLHRSNGGGGEYNLTDTLRQWLHAQYPEDLRLWRTHCCAASLKEGNRIRRTRYYTRHTESHRGAGKSTATLFTLFTRLARLDLATPTCPVYAVYRKRGV